MLKVLVNPLYISKVTKIIFGDLCVSMIIWLVEIMLNIFKLKDYMKQVFQMSDLGECLISYRWKLRTKWRYPYLFKELCEGDAK